MKTASGIPYWPSRDPIEEDGGMNLYSFVTNKPNLAIDLFGLVKVEVDYDPPEPQKISPNEADGTKSHTKYEDKKCICPDDKEWFISCSVSFSAEIKLAKEELGVNGATWLTLYGHEQQHVLSRVNRVKKVVSQMRNMDGGPFNKLQCNNRIKEVKKKCDEVLRQLNPEITPDHKGDPTETKDSPGKSEPLEPLDPLDDTLKEIIDGLKKLDQTGFGID